MENRIEYIDQIKGFAIALVVLGHIWRENPIKIWFYSFHVPIFFIMTGVLYYYKNSHNINMGKLISKKLRRLILPYFIFEFIYCVTYTMVHGVDISVFKWNLVDVLTLHTRADANWFILCLFISEIIFFCILKYVKYSMLQKMVVLLLFFIPFSYRGDNYYILLIERCFLAIGFIYFGYFIADYIRNIRLNKYCRSIGLVMCIFLAGLIANLNGLTGMFSMVFHTKTIWIFNSLFSSLSVLLFFKYRKKKYGILNFWGENSLLILGLHGNFLLLTENMGKDTLSLIRFGIIMTLLSFIIIAKKYIDKGKFKSENIR